MTLFTLDISQLIWTHKGAFQKYGTQGDADQTFSPIADLSEGFNQGLRLGMLLLQPESMSLLHQRLVKVQCLLRRAGVAFCTPH